MPSQHWVVRFDKHDVYVLASSPCRYADIIMEGERTARMVGPSGKFAQMATRTMGNLLAPAFNSPIEVLGLFSLPVSK